ncbi:hypothetical protein [Brevibacillus sp. NRS-1366]|uniref:hypothetical protein n=1 Tax=Brevibacillus sp. NRS-1366 TaxID=3233899 RepID=UPI003D21F9E8
MSIDGWVNHLGSFKTEVSAANCYNYYAKLHYGEFAQLNNVVYMSKEEWESLRRVIKTSKYRGVSLVRGKYLAQIWDGKRNCRIGVFEKEDDAAFAYNEVAIKLKGNKAKINKITR